MTVNTTAQGNISLNSIKNETNSSNITWSNTSLRSVSSLAGKSIPDAMSEFSGYSHIITNTYSATGTNAQWGKGSRRRVGRVITSYYIGSAQGSGGTPSPLSTDGFGLSLTCQAAAWYEGATTGTTGFRWEATSSSSTGADTTWWNKVTISRSGQTDVVLLRSAATTNSHSNYRYSIFWPTSTTVNYIADGVFTWTFSS